MKVIIDGVEYIPIVNHGLTITYGDENNIDNIESAYCKCGKKFKTEKEIADHRREIKKNKAIEQAIRKYQKEKYTQLTNEDKLELQRIMTGRADREDDKCQEKIADDFLNQLNSERIKHLEIFSAAYLKFTNLDPRDVVLIEEQVGNSFTWRFELKSKFNFKENIDESNC